MTDVLRLGHEPDPAKRIRQRQGERIRKTRQLRQMSPAELATHVGVHESSISHWEMGRFAPRQHHQILIAKALDVPHSMLFGLDAEVAS